MQIIEKEEVKTKWKEAHFSLDLNSTNLFLLSSKINTLASDKFDLDTK